MVKTSKGHGPWSIHPIHEVFLFQSMRTIYGPNIIWDMGINRANEPLELPMVTFARLLRPVSVCVAREDQQHIPRGRVCECKLGARQNWYCTSEPWGSWFPGLLRRGTAIYEVFTPYEGSWTGTPMLARPYLGFGSSLRPYVRARNNEYRSEHRALAPPFGADWNLQGCHYVLPMYVCASEFPSVFHLSREPLPFSIPSNDRDKPTFISQSSNGGQ